MRIFIILLGVFTSIPSWSAKPPKISDCGSALTQINNLKPRTDISLNQSRDTLFSFIDQLNILQIGNIKETSEQLTKLRQHEIDTLDSSITKLEIERNIFFNELSYLYEIKKSAKSKEAFGEKEVHYSANDNHSIDTQIQITEYILKNIEEQAKPLREQRAITSSEHTFQVLDTIFYTIAGQAKPEHAKMYSDIYFGREGKHFKTIADGNSLTPNSRPVLFTHSMPFEAHDIHYDADGFKVVETHELVMNPTFKKLFRIFTILRLDYTQQALAFSGDSLREYYHLVEYFAQVNAQAITELIDTPSVNLYSSAYYTDDLNLTDLHDVKKALKDKIGFRIKTKSQSFSEEPKLLTKIKGKLQGQKTLNIKKAINDFVTSYGPQLENSLGERMSTDEIIKRAGASMAAGDIISYEIYTQLLAGIPLDSEKKQAMNPSELFKKESLVYDILSMNPVFYTLRKPFAYSSVKIHTNNKKPKPSKTKKLSRSDLTVFTSDLLDEVTDEDQ